MNRYTEQLLALQPPGKALPTHPDTHWVKLLDGLAQEFDRLHDRANHLADEITLTNSAVEMLDLWERALGLPDPCAPAPTDPVLRRDRIRAKFIQTTGQSRQFFIDLAARLGLTASISSPHPFYMGVNGMGDPVGGVEQRLVWQMDFDTAPDAERMALIKCMVRHAAPAHTVVVFAIGNIPAPITHYYNGLLAYNGQLAFGG